MITAIEDVFYYVANQARAVTFYTEVLGFRVVYRDEVWAGLNFGADTNPDPVKVGLLAIGAPVPQQRIEINGQHLYAGATLSLRTDDIDRDVARLREAGVQILREIDKGTWGASAVFADPDGNALMLYQPPG